MTQLSEFPLGMSFFRRRIRPIATRYSCSYLNEIKCQGFLMGLLCFSGYLPSQMSLQIQTVGLARANHPLISNRKKYATHVFFLPKWSLFDRRLIYLLFCTAATSFCLGAQDAIQLLRNHPACHHNHQSGIPGE